MSKEKTPFNFDDADVKRYKAENPGRAISAINVRTEDAVANFIAKKPDRNTLYAVAKYAADKDFKRANDSMVKNCIIDGDMELLESNTDIFMAVVAKLGELVGEAEATVKKL